MTYNDKKIDPYDVEALEKSLNDSATRVSTIWVSFLIFSLYLLTAAATVTHRQLFLAEPVKLPVLNIDLPLWGFFFLAPILFVILHVYVLLQVILLARTAAAYNEAVRQVAARDDLSPEQNASLRQRLANTLFAQIFAGSPREREGAFGWLLKSMAWITLALAPILILLVFQFKFLPYHSHFVTWTHRLLIVLGFAVAFQLWPLVLNPARDFQWPNIRWRLGKTGKSHLDLFQPLGDWRGALQNLRPLALPAASAGLFILISLSLATFPGELHLNVLAGRSVDAVECDRLVQRKFDFVDLRFDRLALERIDVIDHDKLAKIESATSKDGERPFEGERTRLLRDRDFHCADFSSYSDLRRVDLSNSRMRTAQFSDAKLDGASFDGADLRGASFRYAKAQHASFKDAQLQGAWFDRAQLEGAAFGGANLEEAYLAGAELRAASFDSARLMGASLKDARLQEAILDSADLRGAYLENASLQGASFDYTDFRGASLDKAELQGASLYRAQLQGASLDGTKLAGAVLDTVQLQGASLVGALMQGAELYRVQLQGSLFKDANLDGSTIKTAQVWRARDAACNGASVVDVGTEPVIGLREVENREEPIAATAQEIQKAIAAWVSGIPSGDLKEATSKRLIDSLTRTIDDEIVIADGWRQCETISRTTVDFDDQKIAALRAVICELQPAGEATAAGIVNRQILNVPNVPHRREFERKLAHALLGEDGRPCPTERYYYEATKKRLREAAGPPPVTSPPSSQLHE
jgi:uncharacterized protein YjbI with pentapeptide repeats